jgi:hypothetical protein
MPNSNTDFNIRDIESPVFHDDVVARSSLPALPVAFSPSSRTALQVAHVMGQVVSSKKGRHDREGAFHGGLFVIVGQSVF